MQKCSTLTLLKQTISFTFLNEFEKNRMDHSSQFERHVLCLKKQTTSVKGRKVKKKMMNYTSQPTLSKKCVNVEGWSNWSAIKG